MEKELGCDLTVSLCGPICQRVYIPLTCTLSLARTRLVAALRL